MLLYGRHDRRFLPLRIRTLQPCQFSSTNPVSVSGDQNICSCGGNPRGMTHGAMEVQVMSIWLCLKLAGVVAVGVLLATAEAPAQQLTAAKAGPVKSIHA